MKFDYCGESGEEYFSLSNCSLEIAKEFINHLIEFILENKIPLAEYAINRTDDIDKYLWYAIKHKRCCICGDDGETHHIDTIGMGMNRKIYNDDSHLKMQLCRKHHNEAHKIGVHSFSKKYHIYGVLFKEG